MLWSRNTTRRRILVVDDYPAAAAKPGGGALSALVTRSRRPLMVLKGSSGRKHFVPDIVLLDIGMPKLNGYKTAQRIREQPWGKDMVLIAFTGWGRRGPSAYARGWIRRPPCQTSGLYQVERVARKFARPEHLELS